MNYQFTTEKFQIAGVAENNSKLKIQNSIRLPETIVRLKADKSLLAPVLEHLLNGVARRIRTLHGYAVL